MFNFFQNFLYLSMSVLEIFDLFTLCITQALPDIVSFQIEEFLL